MGRTAECVFVLEQAGTMVWHPTRADGCTREMFLSLEEVERLLRHVRDGGRKRTAEPAVAGRVAAEFDRLIVEVLLFSGVRNSEFCKLRLRDY